MTKEQLIEQFRLTLAGGILTSDIKSKYPKGLVEAHVENAMEQIASMQKMGRTPAQDMVFDALSKTYLCIQPQCDAKRGEFFIDLPAECMTLPNGEGIRHVGPTNNVRSAYHPISATDLPDLTGIEALDIDEYYYREHQKIWFVNVFNPDKEVRVVIVPKFRVWEDEDEINIPNGQAAVFFQTVMELTSIQRVTPTEEYNNSNVDRP